MVKARQEKPLISVITPSFNQGEYIDDCVRSVLHQSFKKWEHIVVDGKSTDNTLKILRKYRHVRWMSEKDFGYWDAITKGIKMARGKYIMMCMTSDGYLNKDWLKLCVEVLERDGNVSLVWGLSRWLEDGKLTNIAFPHLHGMMIPQKSDWFSYWLMTGETFPIGNLCIRKKIFQLCNPYPESKTDGSELYALNYNFNTKGYLPYNIPVIADFGRAHAGQLSEKWAENGRYLTAKKWYNDKIRSEWNKLKNGEKKHIARDGNSLPLKEVLDVSSFNRLSSSWLTFRIYFFLLLLRGPRKVKQKFQKLLTFKR